MLAFANRKISLVRRGFTLIELLIVVVIIGILATIAVPEYRDYIIRTKVSEGVLWASTCKNQITETSYFGVDMSSSELSVPGAAEYEKLAQRLGCQTQNKAAQYIKEIYVHSEGGYIDIRLNIPELGNQSRFVFVAYADVEATQRLWRMDFAKDAVRRPIKGWKCGIRTHGAPDVDPDAVPQKYLPPICRGPALNVG